MYVTGNYIKGVALPVGIGFDNASANISNIVVKNNTFNGVTNFVFNATIGTPIYIERYNQVVTSSITGATVNGGVTSSTTLTITGYIDPTYVSGTPVAPLADGLVWNVSKATSTSNTVNVKITNITGSPIAFSTGVWRFDVKSAIIQ